MKYRKLKGKKSAMKSEFSSKWHPVAVDSTIISAEEFDSFGGLEELTDYKVIRPSDIHKISTVKIKDQKKKIKKEKKVKKITQDQEGNCETVTVENLGVSPKRSAKQNTLKRTKKRKISSKSEESRFSDKEHQLETSKSEEPCQESEKDTSPWYDFFLPEPILLALKDLGFEKPTPIQELALPPAIRDHRDILGAAETGSGKTLAFGIPIITHILNTKEKEKTIDVPPGNSLKALVLTPTRELAIQVKNHLLMLLKYTDIKIAAVIGGLAAEKQERILRKCPEIVVATPGRLWELMEEGNSHLSQVPNVRYLVIDEADRMVEKGHFAELTQILELINSGKENKRRQTFIFSATLTAIHELPKRMLMKKKKVKLEKRQKLESLVNVIGMKENPKIIDITRRAGVAETLSESRINCTTEEKDLYIYYFISMYPGRTLVFCNSISSVRRLKNVLDLLECKPLPLHASMQQRQRLKNIERFAANKNSLLLATDVAARGLDIKGIEHVVHFQAPRTTEVYVHRSGRTARAQNEGLSLMLIDAEESTYYRRICHALNQDQPLPVFPVDQHIYKIIKDRVVLSRQIDKMQHRVQRLSAQNSWFIKAAEDMDIDIEDENLLSQEYRMGARSQNIRIASASEEFSTASANHCKNAYALMDTSLNDLGDAQQRSQQSQQLKMMKKQLKLMLQKPIVPKSLTGRYPTKSGKLVKAPVFGAEKAYEVMKKKHKLSHCK